MLAVDENLVLDIFQSAPKGADLGLVLPYGCDPGLQSGGRDGPDSGLPARLAEDFQFLGSFGCIGIVGIVTQGALGLFGCLAGELVINMVAQGQGSDKLSFRRQIAGQAAGEALDETVLGRVQGAKQGLLRSIEMFTGLSSSAIDAVRDIQIDRFRAHLLAGAAVFCLAKMDSL